MRSIVKFSTKLSLAALTVFLTMSGAFANTLSEIQINAENSGYGIVLKTNEAAEMKKVVSSNDKMYIELKNVEASPELDTVYNNVANIENVTISPSAKSDLKITFKGENIADSKVYFETVKTSLPLTEEPKQSIQLSGPVSSYTPVYNPDAFAVETEESQTANPQVNEVLTKMHITRSMLVTVKRYIKSAINKTTSGDINMMTILGVIFIIAAFMLKPSKKGSAAKAVQRQQSLTGILSQKSPQLEREIGLNRQMVNNMSLTGNTSLNPVKTGYGIRAYQQSQKNPYMTVGNNMSTNGISGIARRKPLQNTAAPVKKQTLTNKPVSATKMGIPVKSKTPSILNPTVKNSQVRTQPKSMEPSDLDSMKFLESITKIYEKNGRADLAKGLKDNLRKAQMSNHATV